MPKFTEGPWRVVIDDTGGPFTGFPYILAPDEIESAVVHRAGFKQEFWGELSMRECVANARLIAASPELYEQLADLLTIDQWTPKSWETRQRTIRNILARVDGEA
jgi:hypothetical protein